MRLRLLADTPGVIRVAAEPGGLAIFSESYLFFLKEVEFGALLCCAYQLCGIGWHSGFIKEE